MTALTTGNGQSDAVSNAEPRTFARTALTHVQNDFGRRAISAVPASGLYLSLLVTEGIRTPPCRMDGYALRRVKALLNKVGIVRFHELLDQA